MFDIFLIILGLLFATIAWRDLQLGIAIIAAALPAYLLRFSIGPVPMTFLEVMILILAAGWIFKHKPWTFRTWNDLRSMISIRRSWRLPMLLLILAALIGVLVAPNTLTALGILKAYYIEPILLFLVAIDQLRDEKDRERVVTALGIGALFVAIFAIVQKLTGAGIPAPWDVEGRATSIFPFPNAVSLYLGPIFILGVFSFFRHRVFWTITLLFSSLAIFFAQTEAAFIAVPATLFIASLFSPRIRRYSIPAVIGILIVILISPIRSTVLEKITLHDYSGSVRRTQWEETIPLLKNKPIFGAGLSGYPTALIPYHTHKEIEIFQYPHNIILNIWVELGLLGLLAVALLGFQVIRSVPSKNELRGSHSLLPACAFALLEMGIHGLVDVPYFKNDLAVLTWLILALLYVSSHPLPKKS